MMKLCAGPQRFTTRHRMKDTIALLLVFLSFNHLTALCILGLFAAASGSEGLLTECVSKLYWRWYGSSDVDNSLSVFGFNLRKIPLDRAKNAKRAAGTLPENLPTRLAPGSPAMLHKRVLLALELFMAWFLQRLGRHHFRVPVENLAMSIVASSLVNDQGELLSYATTCSVTYAVTTRIMWHIGAYYKWPYLFHLFPTEGEAIEKYFTPLPAHSSTASASTFEHYILLLKYVISFHVVAWQFYASVSRHPTPTPLPSIVKPLRTDSAGRFALNPTSGSKADSADTGMVTGGPCYEKSIAPAIGQNICTGTAGDGSCDNPRLPSHLLQNPPNGAEINQDSSTFLQPTFTDKVTDSNTSTINITSVLQLDGKARTASTPERKDESTETPSLIADYTEVFLDCAASEESGFSSELRTCISRVNQFNLIQRLLWAKDRFLLPPLWAVFTVFKVLFFRNIFRERVPSLLGPPCAPPWRDIRHSSQDLRTDEEYHSDYEKLQLVATNPTDFTVCITEIGKTTATFFVTNVVKGELLILINELIWPYCSSSMTENSSPRLSVVISGLVPGCTYAIQFVNRIDGIGDHLLADVLLQTEEKDSAKRSGLSSGTIERRPILSPLMTLKRSVLYTNARLAEERAKLKKAKKETTRKINALRQDVDHLRGKIESNSSQDEKSTFKIDNLKTVLNKNEEQILALEASLAAIHNEQSALESEYLKSKQNRLERRDEYDKIDASFKRDLQSAQERLTKLQNDLEQLSAKREKLLLRQERLQSDLGQYTQECSKFREQFLRRRELARTDKRQRHLQEADELELKAKGLEQDISRLEAENKAMLRLIHPTEY
ncbi:AaceriADR028Wp [[Ashbya] aceris (nom. inval.)]|nr:AaceriADR028Wp [[Ashbya] aceris (nom. inval.)]